MVDLLKEERIVLKKRRHWLVIVLELAPLVLAALLPPLLIAGVSSVPQIGFAFSDYSELAIFGLFAWWLFIWMIIFVVWTNYYLDVLVITNKRVIDIEQLGLFARDIVEVRMENVEDVKTEVLGLIASLLDIGNVYIQTAAESREVIIKNIPNPHKLREVIAQYRDELGGS